MACPYCDHSKTHKHGKTSKEGIDKCAHCTRTFVNTFGTFYHWRQVSVDEVERIIQSQAEGISLRGISQINKCAYNTIVITVHAAAYRTQLVHNEAVKEIETDQVIADEMWSFVKNTETMRT